MARKADASIAFSLTDNLSQSVARMRTAVDGFEQDVDGLQKKLDLLQNTKMQLKQVDLKNARQQVDQMSKALRELGDGRAAGRERVASHE